MNKKQIYGTIILLILLVSCSGPSSLYKFNSELTTEIAASKTTDLTVNIPRGWFTAEDNQNNQIDLWLIKNDYSATISFVRINPDEATVKGLRKDEIKKIEEYSRLNNQLMHRDKFIDLLKNEVFELNGRKFRAYQFAGSKYLYRTVVFPYKNIFYECSASIKPGKSPEEISKIFSTQNSVLHSIK